MRLQLAVGGRVRTIEIERRGNDFHLSIDGQTRTVDAASIGVAGWSLLVRGGNGSASRSVEAAVLPQKGSSGFDVHIDGFHIPVQVKGGVGRRFGDARSQGGSSEALLRVTAPMPGKVVRVLVKPGEEVTAKQGLVVVEAMKMENELRAARGGRVRDVLVAEGQSVEAGAALVVVE